MALLVLANKTRRKCFISYHHDDECEVEQFIGDFDHTQDVLIARGVGASMSVRMMTISRLVFERSTYATLL